MFTDAEAKHRVNRARLALVVVLAAVILAVNVESAADVDTSRVYVTQYRETDSSVEKLLVLGDGQFFAMLAQDPTLARPEAMVSGDVEAQFAYRAMRPGFGWLGWLGSAGQGSLVPWTLVVLTVLSVGLLYAAVERLAERLGRDTRVALLVILLPGVLSLLGTTGPEIAASACACLAVVTALDGRERRTIGLLIAAVMLRETLLLVVAGLVLARCLRLRAAVIPPAVLVAWLGVVYLRVGALPGGESRFELGGLVHAAADWTVVGWLVLVPLPALMLLAAKRSPLGAALVLPHLALIVVMGAPTGVIEAVVRILLPAYAILLPFASPLTDGGQHTPAHDGRPLYRRDRADSRS